MTIRELFAKRVDRRIEEVVKIDQTDEGQIREELDEYVVTRSIRNHYLNVLDRYDATFNNPHEGVGIWISGFFGSGKSSFAKYLGLALADRSIQGEGASGILADLLGDNRGRVLLQQIRERIPTHAVIFDVSTDRGISSGNQRLTEIMYRVFLRELGYPSDLDLAELEILLEAEERLDEFSEAFTRSFGKPWDEAKFRVAFAMNQASQVMHGLDPDTFPDSEQLDGSGERPRGHHAPHCWPGGVGNSPRVGSRGATSCSSSTRSDSSWPAIPRRCSTCRPSFRASA